MTAQRHQRRRRGDRLTSRDDIETKDAVTVSYLCGPVDEAARRMDWKWGLDRLPDLVGIDLAERFGRQLEKLNTAIEARPIDIEAVRTEATRMLNAYRALDAEAERIGAPQADPEIWELAVDGKPCAIVRDAAAASRVPGDRYAAVHTLDEIGRLLAKDFLRCVMDAKQTFPGATVTDARPSLMARKLNDEIPFRQEDR